MKRHRARSTDWNFSIAFLSLIALSEPVWADSAEDWARMKRMTPRGYVCSPASKPLQIDGRLEEADWQQARWTDEFVDIEGDQKPKPRLKTRAKLLWNSEFLYIGVEIEEPHVWGTLTKHDSVIFHDNDFEFFIDPDGDNHEYYEFEMNALNTGWDLFLTRPYKDGGTAENRWEIPGLITAVHIDGTLNNPADQDKGWSIEIAVPWSALREYAHRPTPPSEGDQWRIDFSRVEWQHEIVDGKYQKVPQTKEDNWVWSPQGIIDMHRPERWGYVQFSTSAPGTTAFKPDPTRVGRDALMEIYHHQKAFYEKNKRWADNIDQLKIDPALLNSLSGVPELKLTKTGFRVVAGIPVENNAIQKWSIRQDSRLRPVSPDDELSDTIEAILAEQIDAWNQGDVDAFMEHYWKSEELTFSSGGKITRGWKTTKENYKKRYPTPERMGQVSFGGIEVTSLGDAAALVLGRWNLQREPSPIGGNFTLVFRRIDGRWVIVHDHTSLTPESTTEVPPSIQAALSRAGDNRPQIERALREIPEAQQPGIQFLINNMPDRDLKSLSAEFLIENVSYAYRAWNESPWKESLPPEIFLNNVLPYANINEGRDRWRADFFERFKPLVKDAKTPSEAAAILNQQIFPLLKVRYSTQRKKADQSPYESIKSGLASCTGLSVLLIDACRSVGVPARFVGTPLWTNKSGNHSWVEVWDNGWHFTGAAEPSGLELDKAWFLGNAFTALRDDPRHAIFAVSFKRTPQLFPLVWDSDIDYVSSVNVTDFYTRRVEKLPEGIVPVMFCAVERIGGDRRAAALKITDSTGRTIFEGRTNDESFDANDHLRVPLQNGQEYSVEVRNADRLIAQKIKADQRDTPHTFDLSKAEAAPQAANTTPKQETTTSAVAALEKYLTVKPAERKPLQDESFASTPLTKEEAARVEKLLWDDHVRMIRETRAAEMAAKELTSGELKMPFFYEVFGEKPKEGRSLYLSMHGGGGAPKEINDRQWENQKKLYKIEEGVYLAPRAPTDTWDLWHQGHIDGLFSRLIENLIVFEDVDPNRVYLTGYSAGGDGVFQLAPRMADRLAAAAMMAGHPNETSPLGLRNLPFTIQMGGRDSAYNRNRVAREWEQKLADLRKADPEGYVHVVNIHEDKGHWMDRLDAAALPWMAQFKRNAFPNRIVWKQDDVKHSRFYWLAVNPEGLPDRAEITANLKWQQIDVEAGNVERVTIRLNDTMLDLDQPITVHAKGQSVFTGKANRTIAVISKTLGEYGDPKNIFASEIVIESPKAEPDK
jgi:ketosteroid isomerase-like protein/predicted peptidase